MEKIAKRKKSRRDRLTQLAQAMVRCASPDVYFVQNGRLQQVNLPPSEPGDYVCIVPDQIYTLALMESQNVMLHRPRS
jgi:hypothetical protein